MFHIDIISNLKNKSWVLILYKNYLQGKLNNWPSALPLTDVSLRSFSVKSPKPLWWESRNMLSVVAAHNP